MIHKALARLLPRTLKSEIRRRLLSAIGRPAVALTELGGFQVVYRRNSADEDVLDEGFGRNIFFAGVPEYRPRDGHVIIDVGAHIGTFSLLSSQRVGTGHVHAIEPCRESFDILRINVSLNRRTNILTHRLALSDKSGTCNLHYDSDTWGHSVVAPLSAEGETVECATLEGFLESNRITKCDFMKINCEGAEFPILLGAPTRVLRTISAILVLYHHDLWPHNTETDLICQLQSAGFHCAIRNRCGKRGWIVGTRSAYHE